MRIFLVWLVALIIPLGVMSQGVRVTQTPPLQCKTGEKCIVEIEIDNIDIAGFARIQQSLPEGFTASVINDGGADFSFEKQRVQFIWLNFPSTPIVRVSYTISADRSMNGNYSLSDGVFSHIVNNKIQKVNIPPTTILVNPRPGQVVFDDKTVGKAEEGQKLEGEAVLDGKGGVGEKRIGEGVRIEEGEFGRKLIGEGVRVEEGKPGEKRLGEAVRVEEPVVGIDREAAAARETEKSDESPQKNEEAASVAKTMKEEEAAPKEEVVSEMPKKTQLAHSTNREMQQAEPEPAKEKQTLKTDTPTSVYRVQFSALRVYKDPQEIKKQMGLEQEVFCVSADGWHKYSFGEWKNKEDADLARKEFSARTGKSAFVVKH